MSIDNFTVTADNRNNTPELIDKEHICVSIDLHKYMHSVELIIDEKTGRVIKINGTDVEDLLYNPKETNDLENFAEGEKE